MATTTETPDLLPQGRLLVGERWFDESSAGSVPHVNPATGRPQREVVMAGRREVDAAVVAGTSAFAGWRDAPVNERRDVMLRIAGLLREHAAEFGAIATLETGLPSTLASQSASLPAEYFTYYAGWVDKIEGAMVPVYPSPALDYTVPEPYGVVAVIIPWNGPLVSIGMKVAPALAAGNCVVLKPSELAPFSSIRFAELCREAGLPPGVLNVVPGGPEAGNALVGHPGVGKVSFTGGAETARKVLAGSAAHLTPVVLELGGKSANIVFADADLDVVATLSVLMGLVTLSGQGCMLPTRLLVERGVYDDVVNRVTALATSISVGDPTLPTTVMGPVISADHCRRIEGHIERAVTEKAGTLAVGGERLGGALAEGFFLPPTVFVDVDNASALAQEEIFGPVLAVTAFSDEQDAVRLANDTPYGLASYIHTNDLRRAHRVARALESGTVGINGFPIVPPNAPFGGMKQSGFGREGGRAGLEEFLRPKNVYIEGIR